MTNDLDLVKQLEKEIRKKLRQVPLKEIGTVPMTAFAKEDNGHVKGLSICGVKLNCVPAVISKFQRLEKLDLAFNQISDISSLKELEGLAGLYLYNNQISDISNLKDLKRLKRLILYNNQISDISSLKDLSKLTELWLERNQISDISGLKELKNLHRLLLMENKISQLPAEFLDMGIEIKWKWDHRGGIFLEDNPLESPPVESIKKGNDAIRQYFKSLLEEEKASLKQLEKEIGIKLKQVPLERIGEEPLIVFAKDDNGHVKGLSICSVKFPRVPVVLSKFQRLEKLILFKIQISDISSLKELKGLTFLKLGDNQISDISSLRELKGLTKLILFGNLISDISGLKELKGLTELDLSSNRISDISSLKELKELTKLYLSKNQISDISSLKGLKNLKRLLLIENKISQLHAEFLDLGMEIKWKYELPWKGIFLEGNPLESPPVEIIKKGKRAIRQYFKSLEGEKQALNEVKVLLVGEGAAGKTSLVKRLLDEPFDKNESQTHGININPWEITVDNTNIKVRLWDFGGQEIMHATHQFFLSKRSLYILVLDVRKDEKTEYWLNHIKSFGGDSPVMVVINKIDENPGFDLNRLFLMKKYTNIKGFYRLSCASGKGIDEFKKELTKELVSIDLIRTTWAKSWFNVKKQLEEMEDNFISYETYQQICTETGIKSEKEQDILVDFLNDLGVILHFKEFHLEDTHVLEPKWITNAVYKIINSEILSTGKGVLELRRLGEILKAKKGEKTPYKYPPDKYKYIFQLMKKFELCFPIDEEKILVPDLLDVGEPAIDFDYIGALKFRICYNFLPRSVMPRFMVRSHKDIKDKLNWRTGVMLENKAFEASAVVKADQEKKTINIYVNGTQKRDYFAAILHTFREINDSFEQIDAKECVPLPDNPAISVGYLHLVRLEKMGQLEFLPDGAEKTYDAIELLEGIKPKKERQKEVEQLLREGKLIINVQQIQANQQIQKTHTEVHTEVNVEVNVSVDLPAIREDFSDLRDLLESKSPELSGKLKEIMDSLDEVTPKSSQEKLSKPMNKLGRFLKKLGDENSDYGKVLNGIEKGIENGRKVAKIYNKFAQWIPGLPIVPDVFL